MAEERYKQYIIPENVSDGSKWRGFQKRNLAEGVVMAGFGALLILPFHLEMTTFLSVLILISGPLLILGVVGVMGDPFSVFAQNAIYWIRKRGPILYNTTPRVLKESPLDVALAEGKERFNLGTLTEKFTTKMQLSGEGKSFVEGEDFEFMDDADEMGVLAERGEDTPDTELEFEPFELDPEEPVVEIPTAPKVKSSHAKLSDETLDLSLNDTATGEEDLF